MSHHIWNMRKSDINDNLVTFSTMQHVRLKIKQGKKVFSYFQYGLFFFLHYLEGTAICLHWALIVTGRALWVTRDADASPPTASAGGGGLLKSSSHPKSHIAQTVQSQRFLPCVSARLALGLTEDEAAGGRCAPGQREPVPQRSGWEGECEFRRNHRHAKCESFCHLWGTVSGVQRRKRGRH